MAVVSRQVVWVCRLVEIVLMALITADERDKKIAAGMAILALQGRVLAGDRKF